MKYIISVFILGCISFSSCYAQVNGFNPFKLKATDQDDIWAVDIAPVFWLKNVNSPTIHKISLVARVSYNYEINFSAKKRYAISIGIGYSYASLSHKGTLVNDSLRRTNWVPISTTDDIKYSRINFHTIDFPIEFRIKSAKNFKLYLGYDFGAIIGIKNKSDINGVKSSFENFYGLNRFQQGPRIRIGFKDFFIYSNFYFSPLLSKPNTPSIQRFEIGISIGG